MGEGNPEVEVGNHEEGEGSHEVGEGMRRLGEGDKLQEGTGRVGVGRRQEGMPHGEDTREFP